jgi:uncharacterized DUF497 family protein
MHTIVVYAVATVIEGDFEWDEEKAQSNLDKHGVSFAEAATVFADPAAVYLEADAIASSAPGPRLVPNETFTNLENTHDSVS